MTENPEMMVHFRREEAVARYTGTVQCSTVQQSTVQYSTVHCTAGNAARLVTPEQCGQLFPHLDTAPLLGGIYRCGGRQETGDRR